MSSNGKGWPWSVLDLAKAPPTTAEVRRAYAKKLKTIDQATDIAGFEALREAYEAGLLRVEQAACRKAAKAAAKAAENRPDAQEPDAEEVGEAEAPPPFAREPVAQLPTVVSDLPEIPAPAEAQPSVAEQLHLLLAKLHENNILLSANQRILLLLEDQDFRAPEHDATLRAELSDYLLSQLLFNHLNEPYLRHPGLSAEVLRALDARFGWLSDYTSFRADFGSSPDLMEAMVDAAGLERKRPEIEAVAPLPIHGSRLRVLLSAFALTILWIKLRDWEYALSPDSQAAKLLSLGLLTVPVAMIFVMGTLIYATVQAEASKRHFAVGLLCWASAGIFLAISSSGSGVQLNIYNVLALTWLFVTVAAGVGYSCLWLACKALPLLRRLRHRS